VLSVRPLPVRDRDGMPYEVMLELLRDGAPFGEVGERCGYFVATTAARLRAARAGAAGDDAFPASSVEAGLRSWAVDEGADEDALWSTLQHYLPRDRELFCFRARDPDDLATVGQLRASLEEQRTWVPAAGGRPGRWRLGCRVLLDAWGRGGIGVRAVLTSGQLLAFLENLVEEFAAVGAAYDAREDARSLRRPVG
jgi:hypothetical protein